MSASIASGNAMAPSILKTKRGGHADLSLSSMTDYSDLSILTAAAAAASGYDSSSTPKRRKQDPKTGKGLRHFSMKVRPWRRANSRHLSSFGC